MVVVDRSNKCRQEIKGYTQYNKSPSALQTKQSQSITRHTPRTRRVMLHDLLIIMIFSLFFFFFNHHKIHKTFDFIILILIYLQKHVQPSCRPWFPTPTKILPPPNRTAQVDLQLLSYFPPYIFENSNKLNHQSQEWCSSGGASGHLMPMQPTIKTGGAVLERHQAIW